MNCIQYPGQQQQYGGVPRPTNGYQTVGWSNRIRPVSSIEEVKAASIDFDGSVFYFSDLANKKIYTKQITLDGTAQLNMYELKEMPVAEQPVAVDPSMYITRMEFEEAMNRLKNYLIAPTNENTAPAAADQPVKKEQRSFDF